MAIRQKQSGVYCGEESSVGAIKSMTPKSPSQSDVGAKGGEYVKEQLVEANKASFVYQLLTLRCQQEIGIGLTNL